MYAFFMDRNKKIVLILIVLIISLLISGFWFLLKPNQSALELTFLQEQGFLDKNGKPFRSPGLTEQNLNAPDESFQVLATKLNKNTGSYQLAFKLENKSNQNKEFYLIPVSEKDQLEFKEIKGLVNNTNILAINQDDVQKQPLESLYDIKQHKKELNPELAKAYDDIQGNNYQGDPIKIILAPNSTLIARSQWEIKQDKKSQDLKPVYFLVYGSAGGAKEELTILTVYSHPEQGEDWEVEFTTVGRADLKIIPDDQATIDDDEFVGLYCNGEERIPEILPGDIIYYSNWECLPRQSGAEAGAGIGKVVHYTLVAGYHTLHFEFGDQVAYAYNGLETITVRSETTGFGTTENTGNFEVNTPGTMANDDYLVVIIGKDDDPTITVIDGTWTDYTLESSAGNALATAIFYRIITDWTAEPVSYTFDSDKAEEFNYWIGSIDGIDLTTPEDVSFTGKWTYLQDDISPAAPTTSTATDGAFVLAAFYTVVDTSTTIPGSPWDPRADDVAGAANTLNVVSETVATQPGPSDTAELTDVAANQETQVAQFPFRPASTNAAPVISSVEDGPDQIEVGQVINFDVYWSDGDSEGVKMVICKSNSVTEADPPVCLGGEWCSDKDTYNLTTLLSCTYRITSADTGTKDYYAFVCDNDPECSAVSSGQFIASAFTGPSLRFNNIMKFKFRGRIK